MGIRPPTSDPTAAGRTRALSSPGGHSRKPTPAVHAGISLDDVKEGSLADRANKVLIRVHEQLSTFSVESAEKTLAEVTTLFPLPTKEEIETLATQDRILVAHTAHAINRLRAAIEKEKTDTSSK